MVAKIDPEPRLCHVCGGTFLVGGTGNKKRSTKTCSWQCRDKARFVRKGKSCSTLTTEQSAYLAGMLDADGHIGLYGRAAFHVTISVSNTHKEMLEWIQEVTGIGSVNRQHVGSDRRKPTFTWNATSHAAVTLLEQLLPYMIVKRERAELALSYHRILETPEGRLDTAMQLEYRERMLLLNRRGPVLAVA